MVKRVSQIHFTHPSELYGIFAELRRHSVFRELISSILHSAAATGPEDTIQELYHFQVDIDAPNFSFTIGILGKDSQHPSEGGEVNMRKISLTVNTDVSGKVEIVRIQGCDKRMRLELQRRFDMSHSIPLVLHWLCREVLDGQ